MPYTVSKVTTAHIASNGVGTVLIASTYTRTHLFTSVCLQIEELDYIMQFSEQIILNSAYDKCII